MHIAELIQKTRGNIFDFSRQVFRFEPTEQQKGLFRAVQDETHGPASARKKGILVASGQGTGKTAATGIVASFRMFQAPLSRVIVTAPTMRQVQDVWMAEFRKRVYQGHPGLRKYVKIDTRKVTVAGIRDWGISTATSSRPENVQGYHDHMLTFLADEASGLSRPIWQTIKGTLTQPQNLLLAIGNPNDRDTEFFDGFNKDAHLYRTFNWSSIDSPNVDRKLIQKMRDEYGEDSDVFRVRVLGLFPRESAQAVIRYEDVIACARASADAVTKALQTPQYEDTCPAPVRQIGIDLARYGSDESAIMPRYNSHALGLKTFAKTEPDEVVAYAFDWQKRLGWRNEETVYCVDAGGMGQGVMNMFYSTGRRVFEFHSQGTAFEPHIYKGQVTEAYFNLRKQTRDRSITLPEDIVLFTQLTSRQYHYDRKEGIFVLESKDEYLTRVGKEEFTSPDRADCCALAFYPYAAAKSLI